MDGFNAKPILDDLVDERRVWRDRINFELDLIPSSLACPSVDRVSIFDDIFHCFAKLHDITVKKTCQGYISQWEFTSGNCVFVAEVLRDQLNRDAEEYRKAILCTLKWIERELELPHWEDVVSPVTAATINDHDLRDLGPIDEMHELKFYSSEKWRKTIQDFVKKGFHVPNFVDLDKLSPGGFVYNGHTGRPIAKLTDDQRTALLRSMFENMDDYHFNADAVTTTGVYDLKTCPQLMWPRGSARTGDAVRALKHFLNAQYGKDALEIHSPSKALYEVSKLAAKCMSEGIRKTHEDGLDAIRYMAEAARAYADEVAEERKYKDYYYMLPPRCGKSMAIAAVKCFEEDALKKEESMHIVIHHGQVWDMRRTSAYFMDRFNKSPFRGNIIVKHGGYAFESRDGKFLLDIRCGDRDKLAGLCPHYFYADTLNAREMLRQGASKRDGKELSTMGVIYDVAYDFFTKHYPQNEEEPYDWSKLTPDETMHDMKTLLNRRKCAERYFDDEDYIWEISEDILFVLKQQYPLNFHKHAGLLTIFGIEVREDHLRYGYVNLVKKEKENAMNMNLIMNNDVVIRYNDGTEYKARVDVVNHHSGEPTSMSLHLMNEDPIGKAHNERRPVDTIREHNIQAVEELIDRHFHGARLYTQYNATSLRLECVVVMDEHHVEFHVDCGRLVTFDDRHYLFRKISREFHILKTRRELERHRPTFSCVPKAYILPEIDNVIYNDPATIVYWKDGTKTVVQARGEKFDPEKGLAMAISKKAMGNKREYYHPFLKWVKKYAKQKNPAYPGDYYRPWTDGTERIVGEKK